MTIEELAGTVSLRALPQPDHASRHYWQCAAEGRWSSSGARAAASSSSTPDRCAPRVPARPSGWMPRAGAPCTPTRSSDRTGRRRSPRLSPYAVGIVELDEGVRMMSNIVDCDVEALHVGMALEVVLLKAADDVGLPFWRPVAG